MFESYENFFSLLSHISHIKNLSKANSDVQLTDHDTLDLVPLQITRAAYYTIAT